MALAADHQVVVDGDAQTAYGAAKMAVLGLMNCLAIEGRKNNILVNALSPGAATRMTRSLISPELARHFGAELVSPAVAWLRPHAVLRNQGRAVRSDEAGD